jgi:diguanylate cyclase (GGDEF)-like protein
MDDNLHTVINIILNKWAVAIQISIISVIAITFVALWRKFPRKIAHVWMKAWLLNLLGLCSIFAVLMLADKKAIYLSKTVYLVYAYCKIWYALFLVNGLNHFLLDDSYLNFKKVHKWHYLGLIIFCLLLFFPFSTLHIQLFVYIYVGITFVIGGLRYLRKPQNNYIRFLQLALLFEGLTFLQHAFVLYPTLWGGSYPSYMTHVSFLDSIIELIIGIACLLAIVYEIIDEIQYSNIEMEKAQDSLRELVDIDPLTGLWNRRKIPVYLDEIKHSGTLVYIDINDFKIINDTQGHNIGDLCLKRIANCMKLLLNKQAGIFRLGGDEFLVVIPNDCTIEVKSFISQLQANLSYNSKSTPAFTMAIGTAKINAETSYKQALEYADALMYKSKEKKKR